MLKVRTKRPLGGVRVSTGYKTAKEAERVAIRIIKPGHLAIVKRGNLFDVYVY